jgi:hypothetical protein
MNLTTKAALVSAHPEDDFILYDHILHYFQQHGAPSSIRHQQ